MLIKGSKRPIELYLLFRNLSGLWYLPSTGGSSVSRAGAGFWLFLCELTTQCWGSRECLSRAESLTSASTFNTGK